jgi:hypothetical protein
MEERKKMLRRELTDQEVRQICDNFLNPQMMRQYLELSLISQEVEERTIARRYDREGGIFGFFKAVLIGVTYNFIFVILLILIFSVVKDQTITILEKLDGIKHGSP